MKALLQTAAVLAFAFPFAGGMGLVGAAALNHTAEDFIPVAAVGLVFIGMGFFAGAILLVAAERIRTKNECR